MKKFECFFLLFEILKSEGEGNEINLLLLFHFSITN
jgi:hypothetical protein